MEMYSKSKICLVLLPGPFVADFGCLIILSDFSDSANILCQYYLDVYIISRFFSSSSAKHECLHIRVQGSVEDHQWFVDLKMCSLLVQEPWGQLRS